MATRKKAKPKAGEALLPPLPIAPLFQLIPDPFQAALAKSQSPAALLGKRGSPDSWAKIAAHLEKPIDRFEVADYRHAIELMGYWVDALTVELETERLAAMRKLIPRKRGRPPNPKHQLDGGLLAAINAPNKGGRPVIWSPELKQLLADTVDNIKATHGLRSYDAAIAKLMSLIAEQQGKSQRSTFTKPLQTIKNTLRNAAERGRRLRSKPSK